MPLGWRLWEFDRVGGGEIMRFAGTTFSCRIVESELALVTLSRTLSRVASMLATLPLRPRGLEETVRIIIDGPGEWLVVDEGVDDERWENGESE